MANYKLGELYTALNKEEAKEYIGKKGFFSDFYKEILDDETIKNTLSEFVLERINDGKYPFESKISNFQFFRPILEEEPRRMTEEELIEWGARGNGLIACYPSDIKKGAKILWGSEFISWDTDLKKEVGENVRIKHFGTDEILVPTRDIFIKDCRS